MDPPATLAMDIGQHWLQPSPPSMLCLARYRYGRYRTPPPPNRALCFHVVFAALFTVGAAPPPPPLQGGNGTGWDGMGWGGRCIGRLHLI